MNVSSRGRRLPAAMGAAALTLSLAACGTNASASTALADSPQCAPYQQYQGLAGTTVTGMGSVSKMEANLYRQAWRTFSDCTGIRIDYKGSDTFEKDIKTVVDSGKTPDFAIFPQPGLMATFADAGKLKPVPAAARKNVQKGWSADWQKYGTVNGTLYGTPFDSSVKSFVWYSPTYFKAKGYQVPQTWDEMIALSNKVVADGVKPWCDGVESGAATGWAVTDWMEEVMLLMYGPDVYDQWVNHQIPFNDPKVLAVADKVATILKNPAYVNGGFGDVRSIATTNFAAGGLPILQNKCVMHKQASFYANQWPRGTKVTEDGDAYAFYFPPIDPSKGKPVEAAGEFVAAFSDRPEVRAFQAFLTSTDFVNARVKLGGFVSANRLSDINLYSSPIDKLSAQILRDPNAVVRFDGSDAMPAAVGAGTFWTEMTAWINGKDTRAVLDAIEASWPK